MKQSNPVGTLFLLAVAFLMIYLIINLIPFLMIYLIIKLIPIVTFLVDFILSLL